MLNAKKKGNKGWFKKGIPNVRRGIGGIDFSCIVCGIKCHKNKRNKNSKYLYCTSKCRGIDKVKENNHNWKGDGVGKRALHLYMKRKYGTPLNCDFCAKESPFIDWASKGHVYTRRREDWLLLCRKCHKNYDKR